MERINLNERSAQYQYVDSSPSVSLLFDYIFVILLAFSSGSRIILHIGRLSVTERYEDPGC